MKKLLVLSLLFIMATGAAVAGVTYSRELYEKAIMGDGQAMFELSTCYRMSMGVSKDVDKANYWLERAAQEGNPNAIATLEKLGNETSLTVSKRSELATEEKQERERLESVRRGDNTLPATGNQTFTVNGVSFTMVRVEGGTFIMGATDEQGSDAEDNERPAHEVTLSSYYIGQTEVTQELWEEVMGCSPRSFNKPDDMSVMSELKGAKHAVLFVSWDECQEFIRKLNQKTGKNFRLPTEAEWEYAARGGNKSKHYKYSGSNSLGDVAWYGDNSFNNFNNSGVMIHDVATKRANELEIYDMSGNVYEWCQDRWYNYDGSPVMIEPEGEHVNGTLRVFRGGGLGDEASGRRVFRGGGFGEEASGCRVSCRYRGDANKNNIPLGLRLVTDDKEKNAPLPVDNVMKGYPKINRPIESRGALRKYEPNH